MSLTTIIGMLYLFCSAAAETGPPEYKWLFDSVAKALLGAGLIAAADQVKRVRPATVSLPVAVVAAEPAPGTTTTTTTVVEETPKEK